MIKKISFACLCLAIAEVLAVEAKTWAGTPVQFISKSRAQGINGEIVEVKLFSGYGKNLNFRLTGEFIHWATLSDPSKATLNFDDPKCMATQRADSTNSTIGGDGGGCKATVIYLRPIEPQKFPGLPTAPSTLLTVTTDSNLYHFLVTYAKPNEKPDNFTLTIQPSILQTALLNTRSSKSNFSSNSNLDVETWKSGLRIAIEQGYIAADDEITTRVKNFLALVSGGAEVPSAARQAGISMNLVNKLAELSNESTSDSTSSSVFDKN